MRTECASEGEPSNKSPDISADKSDGLWFSNICKALGINGLTLHWVSGFRERDCERYAAGHVRPPGWFIVAVLRSEQGGVWLQAFMDGSDAKWWRDLERARRIAATLEQVK